jgi:hypothetical protein
MDVDPIKQYAILLWRPVRRVAQHRQRRYGKVNVPRSPGCSHSTENDPAGITPASAMDGAGMAGSAAMGRAGEL